jgi:tripartite-type tricarboxylate transporter receptor subunit TctC
MRNTRRILLSIALFAGFSQACAQSWPNKPVKLVVSQAAGGAPDIVARLVSDRLSRMWGQQVLVDNRPGAGNVIGAQFAARSAPDGYTLFFATAAALVTNPYTFKTLPYDPARDFVPVGMVGKAPFMVLVHPSVQAKTLSELIALEKSQPGKLTYATDGPRNFSGMVAAWLNKLGGTNILQVPYATMPQGIQDTVAGRTQVVILAIPVAAPQLKQGALRALAFTSATRAPGYENVPLVAEFRFRRLVCVRRTDGYAPGRDPAYQPRHGYRAQGSGNRPASARHGDLHRRCRHTRGHRGIRARRTR